MPTLKKILTTKQYNFLYILFFLMIINSLLEALSIGILIPFLTVIFNDINNGNINQYFENFLGYFNLEKSNLNILYILFIIYVLKYIYIFVYSKIQTTFIGNLKTDLQSKMFQGYMNRSYQFHSKVNSSTLISNISSEVSKFTNLYLGPILQIALHTLVTIFIILALLAVNFKATVIVMIIFLFCLTVTTLSFSKKLSKIGELNQHHDRSILRYMRQGLVGMVETKILSLQKVYTEKHFFHTDNRVKLGITRYMIALFPKIFFEFVFLSIVFALIIFAEITQSISTKDIFLTLVIYAAAAMRVMPSLAAITQAYQKIKYANPSTKLVIEEFESFKEKRIESIKLSKNSFKKINFNKSIIIKDLSFYYNKNKEIIKDVNFEILKKENIGIVGGNGSGKSTLLSLICGLLKPINGSIKIDNLDVGEHFDAYIKLIGYIPQNIHLIDDTIEKNISLGSEITKNNKEKIMSVIKKAQLEKLILTLPDGIDTHVGEDGSNLSGGERQKIGIARALYRNPEILVFDEVTSAMDLETEKIFIDEINKEYSDKTIIIVSHRLSALKYCKKIFNMDNKTENQ